ncbi:substrate-binding domain-containing protein [Planotetraspora phitsanulokensis]|uniref:ABC transporter substrate-binding protein n=1 Tax=Planotetraspora phitsanulokensis TaxID=575192 RepID=A0A8J3XH24_9ACTN|nr:substrate-binding domain-containing protein [Planotetraspora phitsanulokensis]GII36108.1 ABC transporter substrate-binding protein [Planotetraspora phitsanulokensis]
MKKIAGCVLVGALALSLAACGGSDASGADNGGGAAKKTLTIGIANYSLQAPYFIAMAKAIETEAKTYSNVKVISTDAQGDAAKLTTNVNDLLTQKVDGIIISGGPLNAAPAAMNAIEQKNVPSILVDRKFAGGQYTSWIGPNNTQIGQGDGQYIADRLKGNGTLAVITGGPADNTIGLDRTNGLLGVVKQSPGITVVTAPDFGGWSSDGGLKVMENLLAKNQHIDAVFCENDAMCLGAQKAISDAGRTDEMFLVAADGQKEALAAIESGSNYAATAVNNADTIGRAGLDRMMAVLAGAEPSKDTPLEAPVVTKDNVDRYSNPDSIF